MAEQSKTYHTEDIEVTYDAKRCIHVAACVRGLPAVFDPDKRPWIQPDQAAVDEVAQVVLRCPTGALHFSRRDGGPAESRPAGNRITLAPDGPLYLHGDVEIFDSAGQSLLQDTRVALCRCGASQNKPFCDGAHHQIVFQDAGRLTENGLGAEESAGDKVTIRLLADGPLLLEGQVEICSADNQQTFGGSKGALCRCGESQNKPFCDGSHVQIGFEGR